MLNRAIFIYCFRYLIWIRKDKKDVAILRADFNEKEAELRNHSDFGEVFEDDLKAMSVYRHAGNLGTFLVEDDNDKTNEDESAGAGASAAGGASPRRLSHGSSIASIVSKTSTQKSLSPLPEEEEKDVDDEAEDDAKSDVGSIASSKACRSQKASVRSPIEEASEEDSEE